MSLPPAVYRATQTLPVVEIQPVNVCPSCEIARGSPKYDHEPAPSSRSTTLREAVAALRLRVSAAFFAAALRCVLV